MVARQIGQLQRLVTLSDETHRGKQSDCDVSRPRREIEGTAEGLERD